MTKKLQTIRTVIIIAVFLYIAFVTIAHAINTGA